MALSKILKRRASKKRQHTYNKRLSSSSSSTIHSLPRDLLVDVVARVASKSFTDLHNMKLCCKDFLDAAEDNHVFQRVSLDKFPLVSWHTADTNHREKRLRFLNRCMENRNLESLYRAGLRECFELGSPNGRDFLDVAAQKGHNEAKYVYGMLLLRFQDNEESMKKGLEHMHFLRKSKCVVKTRNKVKQLVRLMWKNNLILWCKRKPICSFFKRTCQGWKLKQGQWLLLDDDDDDNNCVNGVSSCESCRWDHELEIFHRFFNIIESNLKIVRS